MIVLVIPQEVCLFAFLNLLETEWFDYNISIKVFDPHTTFSGEETLFSHYFLVILKNCKEMISQSDSGRFCIICLL